MLNWDPIIKSLGYADEDSMWEDLYVKKELSIGQLAKKLNVSRNTVRASLERANVSMRGRGGPNNLKFDLTDEVIADIRENGIAAVARKLEVSYGTLYKRLYADHIKIEPHIHPKKRVRG